MMVACLYIYRAHEDRFTLIDEPRDEEDKFTIQRGAEGSTIYGPGNFLNDFEADGDEFESPQPRRPRYSITSKKVDLNESQDSR